MDEETSSPEQLQRNLATGYLETAEQVFDWGGAVVGKKMAVFVFCLDSTCSTTTSVLSFPEWTKVRRG